MEKWTNIYEQNINDDEQLYRVNVFTYILFGVLFLQCRINFVVLEYSEIS